MGIKRYPFRPFVLLEASVTPYQAVLRVRPGVWKQLS